jgi:hypothetical protein
LVLNGFQGSLRRGDLAEDMIFSHSASDQLVVLGAEIDDEDH